MVRGFDPLRKSTCDYSLIFSCGVEQRQLVGLITQRSTVRVRPPRPANYVILSVVQALWNNPLPFRTRKLNILALTILHLCGKISHRRETNLNMNNEEITEKLNTDNNLLDTKQSLIEEFSPKEILERGEIVDGTVISIQNNGLVIDLGQKSEGFVPKNEMKSLTNPESYEKGKQIITYVILSLIHI